MPGCSRSRRQWSKASFPPLQILNSTRRDSGTYAVIVTNPGGNTLSSNAVVRVRVPQQLGNAQWLAGHGFSFLSMDVDGGALSVQDLAGFEAQVSTDLVNWQRLTNPPAVTNGALLIIDPNAASFSKRFYRLLEH